MYYQQQREKEEVGLGKRTVAFCVLAVCLFLFLPYLRTAPRLVSSVTSPQYTDLTAPLSGDPDYPVPVSKTVKYWVINCTTAKSDTIVAADQTLEDLKAANIAETAILCMPKNSVHDPVGYAIRFTRYMGLGLKDGPRRDNGFTWLILYDQSSVEIHEGIGLGLNKFTQVDIAPVQAKAEKAFSNGGIDAVITTLVTEYDKMARSNYDPWQPVQSEDQTTDGNNASTDQTSGDSLIPIVLWVIVAYLGFLLIAESVLSVGTIFGSAACWIAMSFLLWFPLRIAVEIIRFSPLVGGSFGRSGSGGGESARGD